MSKGRDFEDFVVSEFWDVLMGRVRSYIVLLIKYSLYENLLIGATWVKETIEEGLYSFLHWYPGCIPVRGIIGWFRRDLVLGDPCRNRTLGKEADKRLKEFFATSKEEL